MKPWNLLLLLFVFLASCKYKEVTRETGYKGKARLNPWLAAERFCEKYEGGVRSLAYWTPPTFGDALWIAPASVLGNESFAGQVEDWVEDGGHLLLLVDHAGSGNDWSYLDNRSPLQPALVHMLERMGITLEEGKRGFKETTASKIEFKGKSYEVDAKSTSTVKLENSKSSDPPGVFATTRNGKGRVTVLTDARLFRNRWIGDKDHAALLDALVRGTDYEGDIVFVRGASIPLSTLLGDHLWTALLALCVLVVLWLWKSFSRFGPMESAVAPSPLRAYDHHLEALGDFQWRLDKASSLLAPLRAQIVERGQRMSAAVGRRDDDFFQFLADLAGIPRERAFRALAEAAPPDPATLARTSADLQRMLQVLH